MDGFETVIAILCVLSCAGAAARSSRSRRAQWVLVIAFFAALGAADFHDLLVDVHGQGPSGLLMALELLGWCTYLPLAFLIVFPVEEEDGRSPWSWLSALDFLQVTLVVAVAYFHYIYLPHAESSVPWTIRGRPEDIRNIVISVGLLTRAAADSSSCARAFYLRVGGVFAVITMAQSLLTGSAVLPAQVVRPAALLALAVLALRWEESEHQTSRDDALEVLPRWARGLLPAAGPLLLLALKEGTPRPYLPAWWFVLVLSVAIFIVRAGFAEHRRQSAEQTLRVSEERYRLLFEHSPAGVFRATRDGRILECNEALARILGYSTEEVLAITAQQLYEDPAERAVFLARLEREGQILNHETRLKRKDGGSVWVLVTSSLSGDVTEGVLVDMTERRSLEEQLRQAQKMEAVGTLAGGIAHDFNNLLQAMLSLAQVLELGEQDPVRAAHLTELEEHIRRAARLSRELLLFSRREAHRPERLDLNRVAEEAGRLLRRLVRENIAFSLDLWPHPLPVDADRGHLEQVLVNLAVNASDAMPDGGSLTVSTGRTAGSQVWLEVRDTGHGIPPEVREHLFDPFFTTKAPGKGTGLGLSVVYGIVAAHGGVIEVGSDVGRGSAFRVLLPGRDEGPETPAAECKVPAEVAKGAGAHILVVEDEPGARTGIRAILGSLGHEVIAVATAEEAFALPATSGVDLLLTDVVLPGASGTDLANGLAERWPGMRVVLMSGYTEEDVLRRGIAAGAVHFLAKPFDRAELARTVRAALE